MDTSQKTGKHRSKRETVDQALREYTARHRRKEILRLAGKINWDPHYDYTAEHS